MPLNRVTITGADDKTDTDTLLKLSAVYPFVEWGILVGSHYGERFPSLEWVKSLVDAKVNSDIKVQLSLHVCGSHLKNIANGHSFLYETLGNELFAFQRVQLNWHGEKQKPNCSENILHSFCKLDRGGFGWDPVLIFQLDGVNDDLYEAAGRRFAVCGLFDRSHGAGVLHGEWPKASTEIPCGWAGGLGPGNLESELPRIDAQAWAVQNYWVDMETQVRTDELLDLPKVERCLQIANEFMNPGMSGK